ncbi:MAG: hypothetical protein HOP28_12295 [Gemmatimonadales bacterium]|nr:hypothetical protein [Gemmatimonadales bacterium]
MTAALEPARASRERGYAPWVCPSCRVEADLPPAVLAHPCRCGQWMVRQRAATSIDRRATPEHMSAAQATNPDGAPTLTRPGQRMSGMTTEQAPPRPPSARLAEHAVVTLGAFKVAAALIAAADADTPIERIAAAAAIVRARADRDPHWTHLALALEAAAAETRLVAAIARKQ